MNLTKSQYKTLLNALQIAGTVYGVLGDLVDERFKKQAEEMENLEDTVLRSAKDFGMEDAVEEFHGRMVLAEGHME